VSVTSQGRVGEGGRGGSGASGNGRPDSGLLGRERELGELRQAVGAALEGRGALYLLSGEPGIGKTSLADAVAGYAEQEGALVRWGRAWEGGGAPVFWPWVQILRGVSRDLDAPELQTALGSGARWVAQVVPELAERVPGTETPGSIESAEARFALFDAVTNFLCNTSAERPLALLFDDIHAADSSSLLMLDFLARGVRDSAILVLAAYQEDAAHARPDVDEIVADLMRAGRRIALTRLGEADLASLIEERAQVTPPPELVRELHATTDGNPFFASEVVRLLAAEGQLDADAQEVSERRFPLPDTVRGAIRHRLEPLEPQLVESLELAAVIGREFSIATLERAIGTARETLIDTLDAATGAGVIVELASEPGRFRFAHGLMRETLYGDLPAARRSKTHGAVGDALQELYAADPEPHLAELAHHYLQAAPAGYAPQALDYATRAAERAMRLLAYEEADRLFRGALGALDLIGPDARRRAELLLALGRSQVRAGDPEARTTLFAAADAARALDRADLVTEAALGFRAFARFPGAVDEEVVALSEEALERLGTDDSVLRARLLARLAVQLFDRPGAGKRRGELVEEAIAMARRLGDRRSLAHVLINAQLVRWGPDFVDDCLDYGSEALDIAHEIGDVEVALVAQSRQIDLLLGLDDLPGADIELEALDGLVADHPEPRARAHVAFHRARRALIEGRFEEAERLTEEGERVGARSRDASIPFIAAGLRWSLHWASGRIVELEETARRVANLGQPVWRAGLALVCCEKGDLAEARREFERLAKNDFGDLPRNDNWLMAMGLLSEICATLEDEQRAATLYDQLEPFAGRHAMSLHGAFGGPVSRSLALLAATRAHWDAALQHIAAAGSTAARLNARPLMAMVRLDEAGILLARGDAADRPRAAALVAEAAEIARSVGADGLERKATELEAELGPAPAPAEAPRDEPEARQGAVLRREGDVWVFEYAGDSVRVRDSKGIRYIARLLDTPGVEIHSMDLVAGGSGGGGDAAMADADAGVEVRMGTGDAGALLDTKAKDEYRRRLEELRDDVEEADSFNDPERAARAREEMDFIARELARAVGLGGRDRTSGSDAERARVNATRSIRTALKRVAEYHPDLGRDLETTVRTGTFCVYEPDPRRPVSWTVESG
jgi:hypothetical protein